MKKQLGLLWIILTLLVAFQAPVLAQASAESDHAACLLALDGRITPGLATELQGDGRHNVTAYVLLNVSAPRGDGNPTAYAIGVLKKAQGEAYRRGLVAAFPEELRHFDRGVAFMRITGTRARVRRLLAYRLPYSNALWAGLNHSRPIAVANSDLVVDHPTPGPRAVDGPTSSADFHRDIAARRATRAKVVQELARLGFTITLGIGMGSETIDGNVVPTVRVNIPTGTAIDPRWPLIMDGIRVVYVERGPIVARAEGAVALPVGELVSVTSAAEEITSISVMPRSHRGMPRRPDPVVVDVNQGPEYLRMTAAFRHQWDQTEEPVFTGVVTFSDISSPYAAADFLDINGMTAVRARSNTSYGLAFDVTGPRDAFIRVSRNKHVSLIALSERDLARRVPSSMEWDNNYPVVLKLDEAVQEVLFHVGPASRPQAQRQIRIFVEVPSAALLPVATEQVLARGAVLLSRDGSRFTVLAVPAAIAEMSRNPLVTGIEKDNGRGLAVATLPAIVAGVSAALPASAEVTPEPRPGDRTFAFGAMIPREALLHATYVITPNDLVVSATLRPELALARQRYEGVLRVVVVAGPDLSAQVFGDLTTMGAQIVSGSSGERNILISATRDVLARISHLEGVQEMYLETESSSASPGRYTNCWGTTGGCATGAAPETR